MSGTVKFSVVTISYNQAQYLPKTMESVLSQAGVDIEYIICDPGSSDGSRAIIEEWDDPRIVRVFEKDAGPADGLNKGFARATGDIFCYLNSDDVLLPGALAQVREFFAERPDVDVATGHGYVVDGEGKRVRRIWSDRFHPYSFSVGASVQIQPSTFFRAEIYRAAGGFESEDRACWDTGLLASMHRAGANIAVIDAFLSGFRIYPESITGSGRLLAQQEEHLHRRFRELHGRSHCGIDTQRARLLRLARHLTHPRRTLERLRKGPV